MADGLVSQLIKSADSHPRNTSFELPHINSTGLGVERPIGRWVYGSGHVMRQPVQDIGHRYT
jgi:hypothetical protein